jgi:hypothetical protein
MRLKFPSIVFLLVVLCCGVRIQGQAAPSATSNSALPLKTGMGFSDFRTSFGYGTVKGGTLWLDYTPNRLPHYLDGLGIEAEVRDLSLDPSKTIPEMRIDEAQGGAIYSWRHFRNALPYAKALIGYGNIDYKLNGIKYHDSRTITVLGGGVEFRVYGSVWARTDYQYQFWPNFWRNPAGSLNPSGFTFGAVYDFSHYGAR